MYSIEFITQMRAKNNNKKPKLDNVTIGSAVKVCLTEFGYIERKLLKTDKMYI